MGLLRQIACGHSCTGGLALSITGSQEATLDIDMVSLMPGPWGRLNDTHGNTLSTRAETALALAEEGLGASVHFNFQFFDWISL
jgi:hypothetical protein